MAHVLQRHRLVVRQVGHAQIDVDHRGPGSKRHTRNSLVVVPEPLRVFTTTTHGDGVTTDLQPSLIKTRTRELTVQRMRVLRGWTAIGEQS